MDTLNCQMQSLISISAFNLSELLRISTLICRNLSCFQKFLGTRLICYVTEI